LKSKNQELQTFVVIVKIVCSLKSDNNVVLTLFNEQDILVNSVSCEQNFFCEKISSMFSDLLKSSNLPVNFDDCVYKTDFDENKHITTARIFWSFVIGFFL